MKPTNRLTDSRVRLQTSRKRLKQVRVLHAEVLNCEIPCSQLEVGSDLLGLRLDFERV